MLLYLNNIMCTFLLTLIVATVASWKIWSKNK